MYFFLDRIRIRGSVCKYRSLTHITPACGRTEDSVFRLLGTGTPEYQHFYVPHYDQKDLINYILEILDEKGYTSIRIEPFLNFKGHVFNIIKNWIICMQLSNHMSMNMKLWSVMRIHTH